MRNLLQSSSKQKVSKVRKENHESKQETKETGGKMGVGLKAKAPIFAIMGNESY